ncbi:MAG: efflux RND transporter periplasmic adaptor subunit, partial [Flavobacteriaceae bacterium]|nr:efflux RND transporter periplasmic adaptor subunit [Flavobacteriaceae bacterium]
MKYYIIIVIIALITFTSCNKKSEESKLEGLSLETKTIKKVSFTDDQIKAIGLELGTFEIKNLTTSLKINGKLSLPPQHQAQVSILAGGIVKTILVQEGEFVNAGKTLATIVNTEV